MSAAAVIYGIRNCDTVKKARAWLDAHAIAYDFHDYKRAGIDRGTLERWVHRVGWQPLLNRAGTTFRRLAEADKAGITKTTAIDLMLAHPSLIKRPVLQARGTLTVGFDPANYQRLFG